jgi:capsular polysaccharide export protein
MGEKFSNHNRLKNVIVYAEMEDHVDFYLRFRQSLETVGYKMLYITDRYSMIKYMHAKGIDSRDMFFLTGSKCKHNQVNLEKTLEVLIGLITLKEAQKIYDATIQLLEQIPIEQIDYFFIWNGCKVIDFAFRDFASKHGIKTLFFEIANIKGKLFVDPRGTNAQSLLFANKNILKKFKVSSAHYEDWRRDYIKDKFTQKSVPQAKKGKLVTAVKRALYDQWGYYFRHGAARREIPFSHVKNYLIKNKQYKASNHFERGSYVFFPLQVSTDTQIVINGRMDLISAIEYSLKKAQEWDKKLVIKPHPVEKNPVCLNYILKLVNKHKTEIADGNTFQLIRDSYKTITINSTVGLEAKILRQPVEVIGKALYEDFDEEDIERYIEGYLINLDYFSDDVIKVDVLRTILSRAQID